jgi:hypothetical protein
MGAFNIGGEFQPQPGHGFLQVSHGRPPFGPGLPGHQGVGVAESGLHSGHVPLQGPDEGPAFLAGLVRHLRMGMVKLSKHGEYVVAQNFDEMFSFSTKGDDLTGQPGHTFS